jgi:hypothetical protein
MQILAIIIVGRYGPQPYSGSFVMAIFAMVGIVDIISLIVDGKELDQINKDEKKKKEPPKVEGSPWKCPKCAEMSEPQFDSCWKCGSVRKDDPAV